MLIFKLIFLLKLNEILALQINNEISYDISSKRLKFLVKNETILSGTIGNSLSNDFKYEIVSNNETLVNFKSKYNNVELKVKAKSYEDIRCSEISWRSKSSTEFNDCLDITESFWYGGTEMKTQQFWPMNDQVINSYKPYITGLYDDYSSVMERYWLSSSGVAVIVDSAAPLFILKNKTNLCFSTDHLKYPYSGNFPNEFNYEICYIDKAALNFLNTLHLYVINNYFSKPSGLPDEFMMKRPIWSTWAYFKKSIDSQNILKFAKDINANNFSNSQLEIDDKWQTFYGDFTFEKIKFVNISKLIKELNSIGFRTTLWMHPFAEFFSSNYRIQSNNKYAVCDKERSKALITKWWDSDNSIILDSTNNNSTKWFKDNLKKIQSETNIDSFKFDAGEVNWLPQNFSLKNAKKSPNDYSEAYARMASAMGGMIEIRVGTNTQDLPNYVRMIDKDSNWGLNNGLKSVLTTALTFSILGYPFILPDMIGGNAYSQGFPDPKLFIRWTQLNTFLPTMQFSIPPWHYNDEKLTKICKDLTDLHENLVYPYLIEYSHQAVKSGEPIIRPMWWIDNTDANLLVIDDQFMVGNKILVAPVITENEDSRDIYLPKGNWCYKNGTVFTGPKLLVKFNAPIEEIPYFIQKD